MRRIGFILLFLALCGSLFTQSGNLLTLEEAYRKAIARHPLGVKPQLLEQASVLRLEQIDSRRLPEINLNAQAQLQSENVTAPSADPGRPFLELPLFTTQTSVNAQYLIYDGGQAAASRVLEEATLSADRHAVDTELDQLKTQVNRAYFGALLLEARQSILETTLETLRNKIRQLEAGVRNGVVLPADLNKLRVEALRLESELDQARGDRRVARANLEVLLGEELSDSLQLEDPDLGPFAPAADLQRSELELYERQKSRILASEDMLAAGRRPRVSTYAQAGFGYPNPLNFFDEKFSPFALVGIRFSWKLFDWNQTGRERQLLTIQSQIVDNQREAFIYQIGLQEAQYREAIATLEQRLRRDEAIVELQEQILEQTSAQLDQGVITPTEYLDQVNSAVQARLNRETHRLQMLQAQVDYLTLKGLL